MGVTRSLLSVLPDVAAVVTLPLGILAGLFLGIEAAVVVFVVGWLLLVPLGGVMRDRVLETAKQSESPETASDDEPADPLETLRERYAAGEIDEMEFERRLEDLVATEDVEVSGELDLDLDLDSDPVRKRDTESKPERDSGSERERDPLTERE